MSTGTDETTAKIIKKVTLFGIMLTLSKCGVAVLSPCRIQMQMTAMSPTCPFNGRFFRDYPGEPVPER